MKILGLNSYRQVLKFYTEELIITIQKRYEIFKDAFVKNTIRLSLLRLMFMQIFIFASENLNVIKTRGFLTKALFFIRLCQL